MTALATSAGAAQTRHALELAIGTLEGALKALRDAQAKSAERVSAAAAADLTWPPISATLGSEPGAEADATPVAPDEANAQNAGDTTVDQILSIVQTAAQTIAHHEPLDREALKLSIREALNPLGAETTSPRLDVAYQSRVKDWVVACFGPEVLEDRRERTHRFTEEALELAQACGATREEVLLLIDYVYGRPVGDVANEVGGVMTTLSALCCTQDVDLDSAAEAELAQVWLKMDRIRQKWLSKPKFSPLPGT